MIPVLRLHLQRTPPCPVIGRANLPWVRTKMIPRYRVSPTILPWVMLPQAAFLTFSARECLTLSTHDIATTSFPSSGDEPGETEKMRDGTRGWVPFTVSFYSSVIPASAQAPSFYLITVPLSSICKNKWVLYGWPWLSRCLRNRRNTETKDLGMHYLRTQCMSIASIVLYLAYLMPNSA